MMWFCALITNAFSPLFVNWLRMAQNRVLRLSNLDVRAIFVKTIVGHLSGSVSYFFLLLITIQIARVWDADFQKK